MDSIPRTKLPNEEFDKLKNSAGVLITTNGFFSTSTDINIALKFARTKRETNDKKTVLFEITADPRLKTVIFADIEKYTREVGEKEVLFSLAAVFKIDAVDYGSNLEMWKGRMTATDEGSKNVQLYLELQRKEMEECNPIVLFGVLMWRDMGQGDKAEKCFTMLLETFPKDHEDIDSVYNNLGNIFGEKGELNLPLEYHQRAYDIRQRRFPTNQLRIAASLNNIGLIYKAKGDSTHAL
ncbi:unnamed protein product [Didymodactylos carnosus]|uniref:Uncharacterized protein n=1 Tax=Didymodactylos carnosus TaxID=1234261 RepID=A0A8S2DWC1_9BILA|nr:unnamed protein product [Didymodactylos carnosus]CAF3769519.1 unnamed protein product [Didymodactylos carnosus]